MNRECACCLINFKGFNACEKIAHIVAVFLYTVEGEENIVHCKLVSVGELYALPDLVCICCIIDLFPAFCKSRFNICAVCCEVEQGIIAVIACKAGRNACEIRRVE